MLCRTEITVDYCRQVCDHWSMLTFACQSHGATSHKASFTSLLVWIMLSLVIRSWLILDMLSIGRTWTLPQRWLSLQMLLFRRFVSRVLIDTVEQSSRLQREECIFFQVKSCTSKSFSREKARASAKTHCEPKTLRQTHRISNAGTGSLISLVAGSQEHMLQLLVGAHGERDWVVVFRIDMFGRQMNRLHRLSPLIHPKRRT